MSRYYVEYLKKIWKMETQNHYKDGNNDYVFTK